MGTKEFNLLDKLIARMRLGRVLPYVEKGDTILDFGCGHQAYLLKHIKNSIKHGIGLDYDSKTAEIGPNVQIRNFHFKNKLPFPNNHFDKIFSIAVIEHIEIKSIPYLFRELQRVLKPGGLIVLTTPTPLGKIILEFLAFRLRIISKQEVADHKKYYSKADMVELSNRYGFNMEIYKTFQLGGNSLCVLRK